MNNSFKVGDIVSRKKYGNDILFKIDRIIGNKVYLKGLELRLYADASIEDIVLSAIPKKKEVSDTVRKLNTNDYFYIPGIILHIDTEFQLNNTLTNPYKIRKKSIFENGKIN